MSPVIGVMLMLVVTVILAAAVSSTSSGLMKSTDKAPTAVFDVKIVKDFKDEWMGLNSHISIKEVTGDAIQTKDIKIVTTNPKANGIKIREKLPGGEVINYAGGAIGIVPYWNNVAMGYFGFSGFTPTNNPAVNFGNYTLKPGVSMSASQYDDGTTTFATWDGTDYVGDVGQMQDMFADWDSISNGDFVNVKIIHLPTNKVIFASDVEVV
ncbi:MAG: type IV pilin N-terminal domain-containing protein [Methanomethylovorans sp.]|uniref:type IV pilin N-terminal domain-containing protein n=1 Tax=Methanomethylovorans sp. TaxID=2758717 RepID=UPI003C75652A